MRFVRFALAGLAVAVMPDSAMAQPIMQVHKTIFLCADESDLFDKLKPRLPLDVTLVDGRSAPSAADWTQVTLAVFGRHDGAAAQCVRQHPKGDTILDLVRVDAEISLQKSIERFKNLLGDKFRGVGPMGQFIDRDGGEVVNWFADICFAPNTSESCDFDGPSEFVRLISDAPAP